MQLDLKPCFFKLSNIDLNNNTVIAYIMNSNGVYTLKEINIPSVIHNRASYNRAAYKSITSLHQKGYIIFNQRNRFSKIFIHNILKENKEISPHLPETMDATIENLKVMMEKHSELILKPLAGSLGIGIMQLTKQNDNWNIIYKDKIWTEATITTLNDLPIQVQGALNKSKYLIQERIPLAKIGNRLFDLRVITQKNGEGIWGVTTVYCKVGKPNFIITNISSGGSALTLSQVIEQLPHLEIENLQENIAILAILIAKQLEKKLPHIADLALDIGILENGYPMFIECNFRGVFRNRHLPELWEKIRSTPMHYAKYLYDHIETK